MKITNSRPITFVTVSFLIGLALGGLVYQNNLFLILVPIALVAMGIFLSLIFKKKMLLYLILFFAVGLVSFKIDNLITFSGEVETNVEISGRVTQNYGDYVILEDLQIDGENYKGKMKVDGYYNAQTGYIMTFDGKVSTNKVNIFDTYLMSKYYDHIFYEVRNAQNAEIVFGKKSFLEKIRDRANYSILNNMPNEEGGIAVSLVFGDMNYIALSDNEAMRSAGLSHIFSVSGLHVGFLVAFLIFLGKKLKIKASMRFVFIVILLILYGVLTYFPSGVKRAGIMTIIYLFAVLKGRENDPLNTLSLSVLIICLTNPKELFDISFLMSAAAILGMICFYRPIKRFLQGKSYKRSRKYIASSIAATVSANVFLLPLSCNIFNSFSIYQIFSNLTLLPLVTLIYTLLIPIISFSFIIPQIAALNAVVSYPITVLRLAAKFFGSLPYASLNVAAMGVFTAFYLLLAVILTPFIKLPVRKKAI